MQVVQGKGPGCQRVLRIPENLLGVSMRCKHCGKVFQLRASAAARPASPVAAASKVNNATSTPAPAPAAEDISESEYGVLPAATNFSPALSRYHLRSVV